MKNWWKILGVLLMLYTLIAGFLIPLKPGVYDFNPRKLILGDSTASQVSITTYNTHFDQAEENRVWLKTKTDQLIKAKEVQITGPNKLIASFTDSGTIPSSAPEDEYTLIIDNEKDGFIFYPDAMRLNAPLNSANVGPMTLYNLSELHEQDQFAFPFRHILYETIRNQFFHVAIWFAMFVLLVYSCYHSVRYLMKKDLDSDLRSSAVTTVGLIFGIAGILTGSMWAKYTWGTFWTSDIKLNMSATALLVYFAYWILRSSISDIDTRARIAAVYNIFAFVCLMILVMVIPRFTDSLHPGNGGNPAMGGEDLDNTLRAVFYPAIIGYTLIGLWMAQLLYRYLKVKDRWETKEY